jgi:hypothetical protein
MTEPVFDHENRDGYAQHWNARHRRIGHVFQGRFRSHLIENEIYFWAVSRYVHLNPCPILMAHPADWPWSAPQDSQASSLKTRTIEPVAFSISAHLGVE